MIHPVVRTEEAFSQNMIRLLHHYNRLVIKLLNRSTKVHENIHQTRLCFKRMRAFLRIGRHGTGENTYRILNSFYRDQSRMLSEARDLTALIGLLPDFIETRKSKTAEQYLRHLKLTLERSRKRKLEDLTGRAVTSEVIRSILLIDAKINDWNFNDDLKKVVCEGTQSVYKKGRQLFVAAGNNCDNHIMHEWRKQVKYFWYQIHVLAPLWPGLMFALAREIQTLSQWLGKHHDLVLFENTLLSFEMTKNNKPIIQNLIHGIGLRKARLEKQSLKLGVKIYAESSRAFHDRLIAYF